MAASRYGYGTSGSCMAAYFPLWLLPGMATSRYGYFQVWLLPAMATSCYSYFPLRLLPAMHGYFPAWLVSVIATSQHGYFPIWLLPIMATSQYGYFSSSHPQLVTDKTLLVTVRQHNIVVFITQQQWKNVTDTIAD